LLAVTSVLIRSLILILDLDPESHLGILGFPEATAARLLLAFVDWVAVLGNCRESSSLTLNLHDLRMPLIIKKNFGALVANTPEHFVDKLNESTMVHWFGQLNVTKVTWAFILGSFASVALNFLVHGAHLKVVDTSEVGHT
jgi:hypothetical protein